MAKDAVIRFYNYSIYPKSREGFQRHHIIPVQIFQRSSFKRLFAHAYKQGFDPRNFRHNGIYLPATEPLAIASGRPLHRGPHPIYNDLMCDHINNVDQIFRANPSLKVARRIFEIQNLIRTMLTDGSFGTKLNGRDPMSQSVNFSHLDADVDKLWAGISNLDKLMSQN